MQPIIGRCRGPVEQALRDAGRQPQEIDRIVFVGGPTRMPVVRTFFESLLGKSGEMGVDPMECVACGAAIQASVLAGEVGDIVLVDVTPLTLGVETLGVVATSLITRNTPVPVKRTESFTTAADMQTSVTIHVFQGERPMAADNTKLGEFVLDGLRSASRDTACHLPSLEGQLGTYTLSCGASVTPDLSVTAATSGGWKPCPLSTPCSGQRWKRRRSRVPPRCRSLQELNPIPCYASAVKDCQALAMIGEAISIYAFACRCQNNCHLLSATCMNACAPSLKPRGDEFP